MTHGISHYDQDLPGPSRIEIIGAGLILVAALLGCQAHTVDSVRFANKEPVKVVNDRMHTPKTPANHKFVKMLYHFDGFYYKRVVEWTKVKPGRRAANINSHDEVPDSTWFTNRIGVRELTVAEVASGSNRPGGPMLAKPWTIVSSKVGGVSIGFIIKDANGDSYLLKFDDKDVPEAETAADVIIARLLWAVGYNVAEDYIVQFKRSDLQIAEGAMVKPVFGEKTPLTTAVLDEKLQLVATAADGTIRGLASRFLAGKPLSGWARLGTRQGDPNDTVAHEARRELRGSFPFFAWLDHTDIKQDNTLDTYTEDPKDPTVRYVMHYLIDLGNSLGVQELKANRRFTGHENVIDFGQTLIQLGSLGLRKRSWEGRRSADLVGVGLYESKNFDPGNWKPNTPSYFPLAYRDKFDGFWAAKILIRLSKGHIRAAVLEGQLSDPRASDYLVREIIKRQRKTARYWFARVNPLDRFEVTSGRQPGSAVGSSFGLCFYDLVIEHDLGRATPKYRALSYDFEGKHLAEYQAVSLEGGRVCLNGIEAPTGRDGYTIVSIESRRGGGSVNPTLVHVARDPATGVRRVIGIRRL